MSITKWAVCGIVALAGVAQAQDEPVAVKIDPVSVANAEQTPASDQSGILTLPSGTPVIVSLDSEISTQNNLLGDSFEVTVVHDVLLGGVVAIPKGTKGRGEITFLTKKGSFGKPGIIGIALREMELNGQQILLDGRFREEGGNNNAAAAATMFAVGIVAGLVKGKSSTIPAGRELKGRTGQEFSLITAIPAATSPDLTSAETLVEVNATDAAPLSNPQ